MRRLEQVRVRIVPLLILLAVFGVGVSIGAAGDHAPDRDRVTCNG